MKVKRNSMLRKSALGVLLGLATVVGLQGCGRGGWHSGERMEKRFQWFEEELAEELEIRPEQQAEFQALSASYKALAKERISGVKDTVLRVNAELEREVADPDVVVALIKDHIQERPSEEQLEALVDQTAAFYNALDPVQQKKLRKMASKWINRHF